MKNNSILIDDLEKEMLADISGISVPDEEVSLDTVKVWYIETEKLIRVLANLLPATMAQPINQLRYAGHHIIKISTLTSDKEVCVDDHSNIIEAYKHCKRAFYDSLDLYVYHLGDVFRTKLAVLPSSSDVSEVTTKIETHLKSHIEMRDKSENRIDYYEEVNKSLIEGLSLITEVDDLCRKNKIYDSMLNGHERIISDRQQAIDEKDKAIEERDSYNTLLNTEMVKQDRKITKWGLIATAVIVVSGLFQGFLTQLFVTPTTRTKVSMEQPVYTGTKMKTASESTNELSKLKASKKVQANKFAK